MLAADVARAGAVPHDAARRPRRRAARAGLPRRPGHAAVRGGSVGRPPRPRAGGRLPRRRSPCRASRCSSRSCSATRSAACSSPSSTPRRPSPSTPAASSCRRCSSSTLRDSAAARPAAAPVHRQALARRRRRVALRRPDGPPGAGVRVRHRRPRHRRRGARGPLRRAHRPARRATSGCWRRRSPSARCSPRWSIAGGTRDHHSLLRTAALVRRRHLGRRRPAVLVRGERRPRLPRLRDLGRDVRRVDPHQRRDRATAQPRHPRLGHGDRRRAS